MTGEFRTYWSSELANYWDCRCETTDWDEECKLCPKHWSHCSAHCERCYRLGCAETKVVKDQAALPEDLP